MASTVSFAAVTVNAPNYPSGLHRDKPQVRNMTLGGRPIVSNLRISGALTLFRLTWTNPGFPLAQYTPLKTHIETTINFKESSFVFTWHDATTYTVHYWDGWDSIVESKPGGRYIGTIILQEIPT